MKRYAGQPPDLSGTYAQEAEEFPVNFVFGRLVMEQFQGGLFKFLFG
jgi:hypothetical protein